MKKIKIKIKNIRKSLFQIGLALLVFYNFFIFSLWSYIFYISDFNILGYIFAVSSMFTGLILFEIMKK